MNIKKIFLSAFCFVTVFVQIESTIIIRPQTRQEAFEYVVYLIKKLSWYKANSYKIDLPQHAIFNSICANPGAVDENVQLFEQIQFDRIYDPAILEQDCCALALQKDRAESFVDKLTILHDHWGFKLFSEYHVVITPYGPGGSYHTNTGMVIIALYRVRDRCKRPAFHTIVHEIVHEIVHIGIEENIVQKYRLSHWEKERLVDLICSKFLLIPDYVSDARGCVAIDPFITPEAILDDLPAAIERFITCYPR